MSAFQTQKLMNIYDYIIEATPCLRHVCTLSMAMYVTKVSRFEIEKDAIFLIFVVVHHTVGEIS